MPSFTLRPTAQGTYNDFALGSGSDKPSAMSDASDGTWISLSGTSGADSYVMQDLPADADTVEGSVTWNGRHTKAAGGSGGVSARLRYSGTNSDGASLAPATFPTINEETTAYALAPGGGAWTPAVLNATEIGVVSTLDVNYSAYDVWATGSYAQAGGMGFLFFFSWLLPLLGAGLDLATFRRAMALLGDVAPGRPRFSDAEIVRHWRAYNAWAWRTYFVLA